MWAAELLPMSEWRSRPPERAIVGPGWCGVLVREYEGRGEQRSCHLGTHRSPEAALACSRRQVKRLNAQEGGAR